MSKTQISKSSFPTKSDFLSKNNISEEQFKKAGITWKKLGEIHEDYLERLDDFESTAELIVKTLLISKAKDAGIHSVRYRIKSPEGLIEKIIRKRARDPERDINIDNYRQEITDLIGVRALHVFKNDWYNIHFYIINSWALKEGEAPKAYYRKGDSNEFLEATKITGCETQEHKKGYRSIHYIVSSTPKKEVCYAEIQVRTIFEEGWSEIDHKTRYNTKDDSKHPLENHIAILNRIAGSADELGTLIKSEELNLQERFYYKENEDDRTRKNSKKGGNNA